MSAQHPEELPPRAAPREGLDCPGCGRRSSLAAKWCTACRYEFVQGTAPKAVAAECPVCKGPAGRGKLRIRATGRTSFVGVPFVFGVTTTEYSQASIAGLCTACGWWIFRRRLASWTIALLLLGTMVAVGQKLSRDAVTIVGLIGLVLLASGIFYGPLDHVVWGRSVIVRLGLPHGRYHLPAGLGHALLRGIVVPLGISLLLTALLGMWRH